MPSFGSNCLRWHNVVSMIKINHLEKIIRKSGKKKEEMLITTFVESVSVGDDCISSKYYFVSLAEFMTYIVVGQWQWLTGHAFKMAKPFLRTNKPYWYIVLLYFFATNKLMPTVWNLNPTEQFWFISERTAQDHQVHEPYRSKKKNNLILWGSERHLPTLKQTDHSAGEPPIKKSRSTCHMVPTNICSPFDDIIAPVFVLRVLCCWVQVIR